MSKGHTVFVVSWVNPDAALASKTFDDYLTEGPLAAMDAIEQATGERQVNMIGYCLGGTLTACTMAHLANGGRADRVKSVTYFTTLVDFENAGDLCVFIDDEQLNGLEQRMAKHGYLEGKDMANTFNMLRANDLIWSFVINNYLLGKDPFPFDLLYWNSDATRMPAAMHMFYLRNMYQRNLLVEPGAIDLLGTPIDLGAVETPTFILSTKDDHIAPWKATYSGTQLYGGPVKFCLSGSGHIAGVVNPGRLGEIRLLDQRAKPGKPGQMVRRRQATRRLVVAGMAPVDIAALRRKGRGAPTGRRRAAGYRAGARPLRQSPRDGLRQIARVERQTCSRSEETMSELKAVPTVMIEDDRVRVTEWRFAPGAATGYHVHEYDYVVVPITSGTLRLVEPDGTRDAELTIGIPYNRARGVAHDVINANDYEFAFIEIELLENP